MSLTRNGTAPRVITIALADDESLIREGVCCLLERERDFRVVGRATAGSDAVRLVTRRKPRVLIVRATLLGRRGLDVARQVHAQAPDTQVIVISPLGEWHLLTALRNGAAGYVSSLAEHCDLARAVRRVAAGAVYLSAPFSRIAVETWLRRSKDIGGDPLDTLTAREREVLGLVAEGYSNAQIAARLSISPRTAESHRANVMRKLELFNHVQLIRFALLRGILPIVDDDCAECPSAPVPRPSRERRRRDREPA
jgi:DNA-binding NarL/FixJ family response regulator